MRVVAQFEGEVLVEVVEGVVEIVDLINGAVYPAMTKERAAAMPVEWHNPLPGASDATMILKGALASALESGEEWMLISPSLFMANEEALTELYIALTSDTQKLDDIANDVPIISIVKYNRSHSTATGRFTSASGGAAPSLEEKGKRRGSVEIQTEIDRADGMVNVYAKKALAAGEAGDTPKAHKNMAMMMKWKAHKDKQIELRDKALAREALEKLPKHAAAGGAIKPATGEISDSEFALKSRTLKAGTFSGTDAETAHMLTSQLGFSVSIAPGTDRGLVREAGQALADLHATYPNVAVKSVRFKKLGANTYAQARPGQIEINSGFTAKRMNDCSAHDVKVGWHPPTGAMTGVQATVTHEFGHVIDFHLQSKSITKPAGKVTKTDSLKVSRYAKKNGMESFAESFQAVTSGTSSGMGIAPHITKAFLKTAIALGAL